MTVNLPLRAACIHGRYEKHNTDERHIDSFLPCPGGRNVTDDEIKQMAYRLADLHAAWDLVWEDTSRRPTPGALLLVALGLES